MVKKFDVIVIGAGHAGLEAVFACAHAGLKCALVTLNRDSIGSCPCNPSVGGPAKGIVTREIDALGGMQGLAADANQLQMKILNESKGAGVRALRAQIDKIKYHEWFLKKLDQQKNITLVIDEVVSLIIKKKQVAGVQLFKNGIINSSFVIITSGTYLNSLVHIGLKNEQSGPIYDVVHQDKIETLYSTFSSKLSNNLKSIGFEIIRLKTGTPPRIFIDSIDFSKMEKQPGSKAKIAFSHFAPTYVPFKKQQLCYLTYTNEKTHKIIRANLNQSAMYAGMIKGSGPRYCPSIEDKVVRFSDKPRHQLFIEPESLALPTMYIQGLSTSLSTSVQDQVVHSIKGLEKAKFQRYGYAIEYDAINPIQLYKTLESKLIKHLFFAGQVNGTSGYEEAAGQGMLAGLNVSLMAKHKKPIILKRNEAYIGVMVDDIVTKGITDPYRLLTSRAEFRLTLRNDNADERLIKYGYQAGIIRLSDYQQFNLHLKLRQKVIKYLSTHSLTSTLLKKYGNSAHTLYALLKRPNINLKMLLPQKLYVKLSNDDINKIEINVKFDGYIKNEIKNHNRYLKLQNIDLTKIKDYKKIKNLSLEAIDKLNRIKPHDLAQAQKIQGITMTDIIMIKYYLDQNE